MNRKKEKASGLGRWRRNLSEMLVKIWMTVDHETVRKIRDRAEGSDVGVSKVVLKSSIVLGLAGFTLPVGRDLCIWPLDSRNRVINDIGDRSRYNKQDECV